ncbi:acyl-CoA dehydrogenase [marine gamma proteobacterium HTCC2143]|uniref:Acyl-CoA dehydrogenase n=1 Tax=marine gamma proteobacterium HTCC2143 TaxID=247633 RepID=A0YC47_9GAMM|nr:acyl-CoA dehydrogenase [marine gamma proteobacterium HTCC2143]
MTVSAIGMTGSAQSDLVLAMGCNQQWLDVVDAALVNIKGKCSRDGKLMAGLLEQYQLVSYDLAFCVAELQAAKVMIHYAEQADGLDDLAAVTALIFVTEAAQSVFQRLLVRAEDLGLDREIIMAGYMHENQQALITTYLNAATLASLGADILDRSNMQLPALLGEEKEMVRESFSRFSTDIVMPLAERIHREDLDIPEEILKPAAELGCFGSSIPERFGGLMPDDRDDSLGMIVVTEELSRGSLGAAGSLITRPEIAARALLKGGTPAQQQQWLPRLASAETLCAISITEPDFGSDVASISLKATPTENGWLLNGSKTWCTFAGQAELLVTLARTDTDSGLGFKGLSMFLVEKPAFSGHQFDYQQPQGGRLIGKSISTIGYRGMHSFDLFFEDYFVAENNLVGGEEGKGKGFYFTMAGLSGGRIQTAARATGVMQAAFEQAVSYARERKVFAKPIGEYQLTQVKLARMLAAITASRQFSYAVARMMDDGKGQMEASLVKLFSCRSAEWVTREAMQIHGGMGYAEETAVSRYFVDARVLSIFEGAEETLALKVIARDLITNA